ncbi:MAG: cytochrome b6-f complex subunit PetN [Prochlorothrix sp.]
MDILALGWAGLLAVFTFSIASSSGHGTETTALVSNCPHRSGLV